LGHLFVTFRAFFFLVKSVADILSHENARFRTFFVAQPAQHREVLESSVIHVRKAWMSLHNGRRLRAPGDNFVEYLMSDDLTDNSMMHVSEPAFDV
jgi:hypothetical protein